jgi:hypothetical protein
MDRAKSEACGATVRIDGANFTLPEACRCVPPLAPAGIIALASECWAQTPFLTWVVQFASLPERSRQLLSIIRDRVAAIVQILLSLPRGEAFRNTQIELDLIQALRKCHKVTITL